MEGINVACLCLCAECQTAALQFLGTGDIQPFTLRHCEVLLPVPDNACWEDDAGKGTQLVAICLLNFLAIKCPGFLFLIHSFATSLQVYHRILLQNPRTKFFNLKGVAKPQLWGCGNLQGAMPDELAGSFLLRPGLSLFELRT